MALNCDTCGQSFPTNASLYMHKQEAHNTPSLILVNHDHGGKSDPQNDPDLQVIDEYTQPKKRYHDGPEPPRKRKDSQLDPNLEIVDEYNDPAFDGGPKIIDGYNDPTSDGQADDGLQVIDEYIAPPSRRVDYKTMYEKCVKEGKKFKIKSGRYIEDLKRRCRAEIERRVNNATAGRIEETSALERKYHDDIVKLKKLHAQQMSDLEGIKDAACNDLIKKVKREHQEEIDRVIAGYDKKIGELETGCEERMKLLRDQIKSIQEDDESISSLTKSIFNCTTMEEIFEIQRLIKNHQLDVLTSKHLKTLQNLFLSLSYGVLPICQPQREKVSQSQRRLVEKIQNTSSASAKRLLKENRAEVVNLFSIIEGSLKLARNSYNRFGTQS